MPDLVVSSPLSPSPPSPSPLSLQAARLRELLEHSVAGLSEHAVAEARSVGPAAAVDVTAPLIEAACRTGSYRAAAIRAVWLARELRLEGAVPALTRCVEELVDGHPVRDAAILALAAIGPAAVDGLLAAFERADRPEARSRLAEALACIDVDDDRIRAALLRTLDHDAGAARLLAQRGDWKALPDLLQAFDRLSRAPLADCVLCEGLDLSVIASAVRALGGALSPAQVEALDDVLERGESLWTPFDDAPEPHAAPPRPRTRTARPGRNDPCPCGSGKKYKRCHLDEDLRNEAH